jgi:hypothetical protein
MRYERTDLMIGTVQEGLQALVEGRHGDPFSILGRHQYGNLTVVRALLPGALSVEVVEADTGKVLAELETIHEGGLFAGVTGSTTPYLFRIHWPDSIQEMEDPYSFPLLLGDLDLHLIGQGTHYDLGRTLGAIPMEVEGVEGVRFAVWAPNARRVSVVGDFNAFARRPASGNSSFRASHTASATSSKSSTATATCSRKRPIRSPAPARLPRRRLRSSPPPNRSAGTTRTGCAGSGQIVPAKARCRSTKCTSARGCGSPKKTTGCSTGSNSASG